MEQLILHLFGDYLTQSDWMAQNKTKASFPAFVHAMVYSVPFWVLTTHIPALLCIVGTHFLIDRFRLARYVVWAKNLLAPKWTRYCFGYYAGHTSLDEPCEDCRMVRTPPLGACRTTGYPEDRPVWLAVWLLIIADNTLHLAINYAALRWL